MMARDLVTPWVFARPARSAGLANGWPVGSCLRCLSIRGGGGVHVLGSKLNRRIEDEKKTRRAVKS